MDGSERPGAGLSLFFRSQNPESASHPAASEQYAEDGRYTEVAARERRIEMKIETRRITAELSANEAPASARKKTMAAKPKGASVSKTRKAAGRPPRPLRAKPNGEKLICRY
jgi:hypothetical protein